MASVALVHDYLTQRGGAERVVLSLTHAFSEAPLHTSLYEAADTFPEFAATEVHTLPLNALTPLRRRHRLALPLLAPSFSHLHVNADVVVCSSSGWAHGAHTDGRKIVYCHTPARWLYQTNRYLRDTSGAQRAAMSALRPLLLRWDMRAARTADRYIANSTIVAQRIARIYGLEAEVVPPPPALTPGGPSAPVDGIEPGYVLCVSRLLAYKNIDAVVEAFATLPAERLVIVGRGPHEESLRRVATSNVRFAGGVGDAELRWLYAHSSALVAASHEDFGLTPLEAAAFGRPVAALRWGGFLDTVVEGETGVFFDNPSAGSIADAVQTLRATVWNEETLRSHAAGFSEARFIDRIRAIALEG